MLELVPNNNYRARIRATTENPDTGAKEPATGLDVTVRVTAAATGTSAVGSLNYTANELSELPGDYVAVLLGAHIAALTVDQPYFLQFVSGTVIQRVLPVIVRATLAP